MYTVYGKRRPENIACNELNSTGNLSAYFFFTGYEIYLVDRPNANDRVAVV